MQCAVRCCGYHGSCFCSALPSAQRPECARFGRASQSCYRLDMLSDVASATLSSSLPLSLPSTGFAASVSFPSRHPSVMWLHLPLQAQAAVGFERGGGGALGTVRGLGLVAAFLPANVWLAVQVQPVAPQCSPKGMCLARAMTAQWWPTSSARGTLR